MESYSAGITTFILNISTALGYWFSVLNLPGTYFSLGNLLGVFNDELWVVLTTLGLVIMSQNKVHKFDIKSWRIFDQVWAQGQCGDYALQIQEQIMLFYMVRSKVLL